MRRAIWFCIFFFSCLLFYNDVVSYWNWSPPVRLPAPINSFANEGYPNLVNDGSTMYFSSDRIIPSTKKEVHSWDIYRSEWSGAQWSEPENLESINSIYNDSCPHITADGGYLYFASYRESGASGKWDLYYSVKSGSSWNTPINLGSMVNSAYNEISPFLTSDGLTMYFSSDRPGGSGGFDIWYSTRDTMQSSWNTPVNMTAVNSSSNDFAASILYDNNLQMEFLYLTTERGGGAWDIYYTKNGTGKAWSSPETVSYPVNTPEAEGYPYVTTDHSMLLFVSQRVDDAATLDVLNNGGLDIWSTSGAMLPVLDFEGIVILMVILSSLIMFARTPGKRIRGLRRGKE